MFTELLQIIKKGGLVNRKRDNLGSYDFLKLGDIGRTGLNNKA